VPDAHAPHIAAVLFRKQFVPLNDVLICPAVLCSLGCIHIAICVVGFVVLFL
jgi:hypothetical protein